MFYRTILLCLLLVGLAACGDDTLDPVADREVARVIAQVQGRELDSSSTYVTRSELTTLLRKHEQSHHNDSHTHSWDDEDHNHGLGGYGGGPAYDHSHQPDHVHYDR